ncbi:MAG: o-succinylbenzoate synthase [Pirellulaceae bacterium]|nr:o-succinylbenzoate synthase [Pirellulaceae bacterium]
MLAGMQPSPRFGREFYMHIDRIELYHVAMPLLYPWRTAYGEDAAIEAVLCRMTSGSLAGWGEASPLAAPCYSPEWAGGVFATAKQWLAPALVGKAIASGDDLQARLTHFKGNQFAKAVLDCAWWSLAAAAASKPLYVLLGEAAGCQPRDEVAVGADFGVMDDVRELLAAIGPAVQAGFPRVKLKFRPGWDLPMLREVRREFPRQTFHIDCNSGYRLSDAPLFREVDELDLAMIEQPLAHDDVVDHAALQAQIRTPICLDESITSLHRAEQAIRLASCRYVNVKPGRVGGLTNALKIHNACQAAAIPCWVGGMLESAVGASQCVDLALLPNFTYPADIFPSSRFYAEDLSDPPLELIRTENNVPGVRPFLRPPEPHPNRLQKLTVQRAVISA